MDIKILKEDTSEGETHYGFQIRKHGFRSSPPVISNWFISVEGLEKQLNHHIKQYLGAS